MHNLQEFYITGSGYKKSIPVLEVSGNPYTAYYIDVVEGTYYIGYATTNQRDGWVATNIWVKREVPELLQGLFKQGKYDEVRKVLSLVEYANTCEQVKPTPPPRLRDYDNLRVGQTWFYDGVAGDLQIQCLHITDITEVYPRLPNADLINYKMQNYPYGSFTLTRLGLTNYLIVLAAYRSNPESESVDG